jgi:hypothetical protein
MSEIDIFKTLPQARVQILNETPVNGPDGWPYLMVKIDEKGDEPLAQVLGWLSSRGIGLVVNPEKEMPDAVLTYGMIWNFRQSGAFFSEATDTRASGEYTLTEGQELHAGAPSEEYLPKYAREILKTFLKDNGVTAPKVLVMSPDRQNYDLCFSLESLGSPPANEHPGVLEALSWFLPAHYSLVIASEAGLPAFFAL